MLIKHVDIKEDDQNVELSVYNNFIILMCKIKKNLIFSYAQFSFTTGERLKIKSNRNAILFIYYY